MQAQTQAQAQVQLKVAVAVAGAGAGAGECERKEEEEEEEEEEGKKLLGNFLRRERTLEAFPLSYVYSSILHRYYIDTTSN